MAVTNYYTVNGRIRGESTSGTRTNYLHDALGSVTATTNEAGTVINTYRYKPYGDRLSKTGVGADPKFQWAGQHGYRTNSGVPVYVRARHYENGQAAWATADPLWPLKPAYSYANASPVLLSDPFGLAAGPVLLPDPLGLAACQDRDWSDYDNECSELNGKYYGPAQSSCIAAYCSLKGGIAVAMVLKCAVKAIAEKGITLVKFLGSNVNKKVTGKGDPFKAATDCCKTFNMPKNELSAINKEIAKWCLDVQGPLNLGQFCILKIRASGQVERRLNDCDQCCNEYKPGGIQGPNGKEHRDCLGGCHHAYINGQILK